MMLCATVQSKDWMTCSTQWRRVKADFEEEPSFVALAKDDRLRVFEEVREGGMQRSLHGNAKSGQRWLSLCPPPTHDATV